MGNNKLIRLDPQKGKNHLEKDRSKKKLKNRKEIQDMGSVVCERSEMELEVNQRLSKERARRRKQVGAQKEFL